MNKVLIITYYWPPSGGAGVQRWLKFSKYLPEFDWEPIILTVDPEYAAYPVTDFSLTEELPLSVKVHKTPAINYFSIYKKDKSRIPAAGFANSVENTLKGKILRFIRGNFFIPDPRRGWNKYAFRKACEIIETEEIKHVITTSPPHSTQLIGLKIKKKYPAVRWIADLRDPWTDIYYYDQFYPTFISKRIDSGFEKQVLEKADRLITVGPVLKKMFLQKNKGIVEKTEVITNGYDKEDFAGITPLTPGIFTISYIGTLSDAYPVKGFLEALKAFNKNGIDFKLRFIGTVAPKQKELILTVIESSCIEFINSVDHQEALRYMSESTILLLIIPDHHSNKSIITGKLFEYIAAGKPVICLGPTDGDAAVFLNETGHGNTFSYRDSRGILDYLTTLLTDNSVTGKISPDVYSRKELTKKVVSLLEKL
jgi:glycosyltransferase involved in cell wall biosynthesis